MSRRRVERDSLGEVDVPADVDWGAQTQRSLEHFAIGKRRMPIEVVRGLARVRRAAAHANAACGGLPVWKAEAIAEVCAAISDGELDEQFPLSIFQTGSGTHTSANLNEVIANRANARHGADRREQIRIDPNDDVNMSQSTNDTFVTAMHIAAFELIVDHSVPALRRLGASIGERAEEWIDVPKIGRTHLMDAVGITVGQEWSGYGAALDDATSGLEVATQGLLEVALGGTAVGTGLNAPEGYREAALAELTRLTGLPLRQASNAYAAQSTLDALVRTHSALKNVAISLFKIANDLRWLASGPRTGLNEIAVPANEPGSTMMPGKVNPTQCEAMLMVCAQVLGNDVTVAIAGAEGNFELNAFRPVVIANVLDSARLLGDAAVSMRLFMIDGLKLNADQLHRNLENPAMAVTAWSPIIGYELASQIARYAISENIDAISAARHFGVDPAALNES